MHSDVYHGINRVLQMGTHICRWIIFRLFIISLEAIISWYNLMIVEYFYVRIKIYK